MTQTLSFSDIEPCMHVHSHNSGVFTHRSSGHQSWGTLQEKFFANQHYAFKEYRLDMQRQHRVQYDEALLPRCMSICLALQGAVQVEFKDSGFAASLNSLQHHSMYAHEREYDLIIDRAIHGIHVAVDLDYYINLLGDDDRWMAALRDKLVRKEHVMQGDASVSKEMLVAIQTIGNNPLKGNLGKLLTEAKILELIALQIGQFTTETKKCNTWKSADRDIFHDLKRFLDANYTEDLSLNALSRMFGLNEFKLKKGFKAVFHTTVFEYIHEQRMNHARYLLQDERKYVNEVAGAIGYKNPNHFSTAFKKRFGVCPGSIGK